MNGLRTFSCVVVLCGAMANTAIAGPRIEARGELGRFLGVVLVVQLGELLVVLRLAGLAD
ncbi:hypothetical protein BTM356_07010 [Helicobacter pylori]